MQLLFVLRETVGYSMLLEAVTKRLGRAPPPRRLLLSALGLLLEASGASCWQECCDALVYVKGFHAGTTHAPLFPCSPVARGMRRCLACTLKQPRTH